MEYTRLKRAAGVGVLALGVAVSGALAPAGHPALAAESDERSGGPICVATPYPPLEDQRSGGPDCVTAP
jgi:hypothetical protein